MRHPIHTDPQIIDVIENSTMGPFTSIAPSSDPSSHLQPSTHSPPSRTRSRRQQFTDNEVKPLLANLSPASTLEALVATSAVSTSRDRSRSFVEASVANASAFEKEWGIKAALAGKKIREWYEELKGWPWSESIGGGKNGFQAPRDEAKVQGYISRVENIRDDMETLGVDELKNHVRRTHPNHGHDSTDYEKLDDFTAVITATIVQSLPTLSYLTLLLDVWSTRLVILRMVPSFLAEIKSCQESMLSAWKSLEDHASSETENRLTFARIDCAEIQASLQGQITQLGSQIDSMLDLLEGKSDLLPTDWVDSMDTLENDYSSWVVKAEELVLNKELRVFAEAKGRANESSKSLAWQEGGSRLRADYVAQEGNPESITLLNNLDGSTESSMKKPSAQALSGNHRTVGESDIELSTLSATSVSSTPSASPSQLELPEESMIMETKGRFLDKRPSPLSLQDPHAREPDTPPSPNDSDISPTDSATSDYFSNKYSPQIMNASVAAYLKSPVTVTTPKRPAWSIQSEKEDRSSSEASANAQDDSHIENPISRPGLDRSMRAMTSPPGASIFQQSQAAMSEAPVPSLHRCHVRVRSASMQSFEKVVAQDIRTLLVRRSGSHSSGRPTEDPALAHRHSVATSAPSLTQNQTPFAGEQSRPTPTSKSSAKRFHKVISPPSKEPQEGFQKAPPSPTRPPSRFEQVTDYAAGSTPIKVQKQRPVASSKPAMHEGKPASTPPKHKDKLESRISTIISNIPADIRLKASSGAATPPPSMRPRSTSTPKVPVRRSLTPKLLRKQTTPTSSPSLTLAPAPSSSADPSPSTTAKKSNDSEIKLYHLHQTGKDAAPVKLYVRLVGETGERVMVRVGGGWADLGEYLREYAMHHGSKGTVSETVMAGGPFDIQTLSSSPASNSSGTTPRSRPLTPHGGMSTKSRPVTPKAFGSSADIVRQSNSRPATPMTGGSRPGSSQSTLMDESPSLGGLRGKVVDIDAGKQAWVDGMVEQARKGGKEEKGERSMGWLGRVGGTQRVFMKKGDGSGKD